LRRTPVQTPGGNPLPSDCTGRYSFDFNAFVRNGFDPSLFAGTTVYCQYVYRDPLDVANGGAGRTDALRFTIGP
jgi:hypothetical protein